MCSWRQPASSLSRKTKRTMANWCQWGQVDWRRMEIGCVSISIAYNLAYYFRFRAVDFPHCSSEPPHHPHSMYSTMVTLVPYTLFSVKYCVSMPKASLSLGKGKHCSICGVQFCAQGLPAHVKMCEKEQALCQAWKRLAKTWEKILSCLDALSVQWTFPLT